MNRDTPRTCVDPSGRFVCAVHRPSYQVVNRRVTDFHAVLGHGPDKRPAENKANFPKGDISIENGDWVYEVPNPFPFWGATYILKRPADELSTDPSRLTFKSSVKDVPDNQFIKDLLSGNLMGKDGKTYTVHDLPRSLLLSLAQTSRDADLLKALAQIACSFELDDFGNPTGICHHPGANGAMVPVINDFELYDVLGNNRALPDAYKLVMVLMPGIQGTNPIVGEYHASPDTHVWEYLRANSYIPWGHYASNMAQDSVRYRAADLTPEDMTGLRHLYYQRVFSQMAIVMGVRAGGVSRNSATRSLSVSELETLRQAVKREIENRMHAGASVPLSGTIWGWNYGFDFSPSGYRLHASHQQIHQQFALIPPCVEKVESSAAGSATVPTYAVGDQVADFAADYRKKHNKPFFDTYLKAIVENRRLDGSGDLPSSLVAYRDENVIVHVPKAQRSQGEVQIMTVGTVGNILEADPDVRRSLDQAIRMVVRTLEKLGAEMVTCYEVSKRFDNPDADQRLFYCFLPRHPQSPGAFSERQERWVTGHYPEDFAQAFRNASG